MRLDIYNKRLRLAQENFWIGYVLKRFNKGLVNIKRSARLTIEVAVLPQF